MLTRGPVFFWHLGFCPRSANSKDLWTFGQSTQMRAKASLASSEMKLGNPQKEGLENGVISQINRVMTVGSWRLQAPPLTPGTTTSSSKWGTRATVCWISAACFGATYGMSSTSASPRHRRCASVLCHVMSLTMFGKIWKSESGVVSLIYHSGGLLCPDFFNPGR